MGVFRSLLISLERNVDGVVKLFTCFVAANFLSLRRTLVRRNDRKFTRLGYEAFYLAIGNFKFYRTCQILEIEIFDSISRKPTLGFREFTSKVI